MAWAKFENRTPVHFTVPRGIGAPHCSRTTYECLGSLSSTSKVRVPASFAVPRASTLILIVRKSYSPGGVSFLVRHSTPVMAPPPAA
jgi:hypothetical protein